MSIDEIGALFTVVIDLNPAFPNCVTRVAINLDINGFSPCYKYWL